MFGKNKAFSQKLGFLGKIRLFGRNLAFRPKLVFVGQNYAFRPKLHVFPKLAFLVKISIRWPFLDKVFKQNFISTKTWFFWNISVSTKISIFDQNCDFRLKYKYFWKKI